MSNLAEAWTWLGEIDQARGLMEEALRIDRERGSVDAVAADLNNLGALAVARGDLEEGGLLYERARAALETRTSAGEAHPVDRSLCAALMTTLDNLAMVHRHSGELRRALDLQQQALALATACLGARSLEVATMAVALADLETELGEAAPARRHYAQAMEAAERLLGPGHPVWAASAAGYARLLFLSGAADSAAWWALRAESTIVEHLALAVRSLPEAQALRVAAASPRALDVALSALPSAPARSSSVWDAVVRSRSLVLDAMASRQRAVVTRSDPLLASLADSLERARARVAAMTLRGPVEGGGDYVRSLRLARRERVRLERLVAERTGVSRDAESRGGAGLSAIAAALRADEALVGYVEYERHEPWARTRTDSASRLGWRTTPSLMAFVTRSGDREPAMIELGAAEPLDARVDRWHAAMAGRPMAPAQRPAWEREADAGNAVREALWDPVRSRLAGVRRVHVIPDGAMHVVNLLALPGAGNAYLAEDSLLLHVLSAERDLLPASLPRAGRGVLAVGGPDFDAELPCAELPVASTSSRSVGRPRRVAPPGCARLADLHFDPLPRSGREAEGIVSAWRGREGSTPESLVCLTGSRAGEAAIKRAAAGKEVVHLATHGFFVASSCSLPGSAAPDRSLGRLAPAVAAHPLLRSGLALAGANRRGERHCDDDGVLTGEEVAGMDMSGVRIAVLSACQTGLGSRRAGEGLSGLRRAFAIAGAGAVLASLWKVDDESTRQWMQGFYARPERDPSMAARQACVEFLGRRRSRGESTHPSQWGAFLVSELSHAHAP
jgi:CHAT domain-containing protein/tetratricopeptide (TPR) repeat protein